MATSAVPAWVCTKGGPRAEKSGSTPLALTWKLTPVDNHFLVKSSLLQVRLIEETKHSIFTGPLCIYYGFQFEGLMGLLHMQTSVCLCLHAFPMPLPWPSLFSWLFCHIPICFFLFILFLLLFLKCPFVFEQETERV